MLFELWVSPGARGIYFDTPDNYNYVPNSIGDVSQLTSMMFTVNAHNDANVFIGADSTPHVLISTLSQLIFM